MSLFEFVTVMVSMILALCLSQLLRNASFLAKTDREIKHYLPYTLWLIVILVTVINHWWSLWDLRNVNWSFVSFLYILVAPILATFGTGLLSPSQSGATPINLKVHFARISRLFSVVFTTYVCFMWFDGPLFAEQRVFGPVGLVHIPLLRPV